MCVRRVGALPGKLEKLLVERFLLTMDVDVFVDVDFGVSVIMVVIDDDLVLVMASEERPFPWDIGDVEEVAYLRQSSQRC